MTFKDFNFTVNLKDKVAILTGASGGIGRSIAEAFALSGCALLLADSQPELMAFATELGRKYGARVEGLVVTLKEPDSIQLIAEQCDRVFGKVDVLINNAGTGIEHTLLDLRPEDWDVIQTTNLKVPYMLSQTIANRFMIRAHRGLIINMASQAGLVALDNQAAYCISKAGLIALTRSCAYEWGVHGIATIALAPTIVKTKKAMDFWNAEGRSETMLKQIPIRRFGEPEEIAAACLYLASGAATLMSGSAIVMDGGYTIR